MVGACQRILDLVLEHVKQRQQFGVAIGTFQAVQHKAVDMHVATERARALSYFAALTIAADDPRRRLAAAMAKASAGEAQAVVFRHGLQLFGAMGFTWENDLQFALKRAKAGELLLGGAAEHRAVIAAEYRGLLDAADFRFRRRGVPRRVRSVPRRASAVGGRDPGAAAVGVAHAAVGARLAAAAVRQRLAAARATAGVRRPQRDRAAAVRAPRRVVPAPDLPQLQPAGREHHCGVADFVRLRRAEAPLGGAGAQG